MDILPETETTKFEDRVYVNPEVSLNEQTSFIDNLRANQGQRNAEINQQTYNLGTSVPSNLGGLTGGEGYWTSRYQTPQTASAVADLRATAQAQALNDVLANEQAKWKKRYNDAYRNYQKRNAGGGGGGDSGEDDEGEDPEYNPSGETLTSGENTLTVPEPETTDTGVTSAVNAYAEVTGGGQAPTTSSTYGVLYDKNGNMTSIKVYPGEGIEVPGGMSYNKDGARNFLQNWVKNGGRVSNGSNAPMADNLSINLIAWDLY